MKCNWIWLIVNWSLVSFHQWRGWGWGGQFSSKIDTKENMFAWMDQRMTQSVLLFGPDFSVLVTTVETDITLLHYIFFKHSWVWVGGGVPDFFFSAPMRFPLSFFPRLLEICSGVLLCCEHDLHIHRRLVSIMFSQHPEMAKVVACLLYSRTEKLWTQQQCANPILFLLVMLWLKEKTNKQTKNWAFVSAGN